MTRESRPVPGTNTMRPRILPLALLLLATVPHARAAEPDRVIDAGIGMSTYFTATHPLQRRGQLDLPLLLVAASPDRLVLRTGGSVGLGSKEQPLSGEALAAHVRAALREPGTDNAAIRLLFSAVKRADGSAIDLDTLRYPAVILVRLAHAPRTPDGTPLNADLDDRWDAALRSLHAGGEAGFSLVVVSLDVSE